METPVNSKPITFQAGFNLLAGIVLTAGGATQASLWARTIEHGEQLSEMSGNRFTSTDGLDVWKAIVEIRGKIHEDVPQPWLVDRLDRMQKQLDTIESKIGAN